VPSKEETIANAYTYACKDYPGMEACPGSVTAETEDEVMKLIELHAVVAHGEDPSQYTDEDWAYLKTLIKSE
jgi:predicted small metal-binding protein